MSLMKRGSRPHGLVLLQGERDEHSGGPLFHMKGNESLVAQAVNLRLASDFNDAGPMLDRDGLASLPARDRRYVLVPQSLSERRYADLLDRIGDRLDHLGRHTPYYAYCVAHVNAHCVGRPVKVRDMKGERIKDRLAIARREAGYATATDAARAFGWKESTYLGYENGDREPGKGMVVRICDAFRISINWLLTGRGSMRGDIEAWFANYITGVEETDYPRVRQMIEIAFPKPTDRPKAG